MQYSLRNMLYDIDRFIILFQILLVISLIYICFYMHFCRQIYQPTHLIIVARPISSCSAMTSIGMHTDLISFNSLAMQTKNRKKKN